MGDTEIEMNSVLYGKSGTGKTTLMGTYPKPLLVLDFSEKGTDSIRNVKGIHVIRCKSVQQLKDIYWAARKGKLIVPKKNSKGKPNPDAGKPFKTIGIDTVSGFQAMVITELKLGKGQEVVAGSEANWGTMTKKDWGEVASTCKEWITNYRDLPQCVVFIAHDRTFGGGRIEPSVGPNVSPSVASTLNACANLIVNTFIRERTVTIKLGKGKTKKKRKVAYCLRVGPHALYVTKIRKPRSTEIPAVIEDPSYDDLLEYVEGE